MNRDEVRKLVGGYATGSLTDAERQALFAAALDDQELFDELADEQSLKELLDEPGVRERLIAALAPKTKARRWSWPWVGVGSAVAGCAAVALLWWNLPKPQVANEVTARVALPSPLTAPGPPRFDERSTATPAAPVQDVAVSPAAKEVTRPQNRAKTDAKPVGNAPGGAVVSSPAASSTAVQIAAARKDTTADPAQAPLLKAETAAAPGGLAAPATALAPSIFPPAVAPRAASPPTSAPAKPASAPPPAVAEALRAEILSNAADAARTSFAEGGGGARGGFVQLQTFGFRYQLNPTFLQVTPTSVGWLTVTTTDQAPRILLSNRMVASGVPLAIMVPADAKELSIQFSGQSGPVTAAPERRTGASGVVAAASAVAITISAHP